MTGYLIPIQQRSNSPVLKTQTKAKESFRKQTLNTNSSKSLNEVSYKNSIESPMRIQDETPLMLNENKKHLK